MLSKSRRTGILLFICLALMSLIFGSACAKTQPVETKTINVGLVNHFSGFAAQWGLPSLRAFQLFEHECNTQGGIQVGGESYNLKIFPYDPGDDPAAAISVVNKLISEDKVIAMYTGVPYDAPTLSLGTANKIIQWVYASATEPSAEYPYFFTINPGPRLTVEAMYYWIVEEKPALKKVAIITTDDVAGNNHVKYLKPLYERLGFKLLSTKMYPVNTTDFYPVVTPVLNENPDIIETVGSYPEQTSLIIKAARELGFTGVIFGAGGASPDYIVGIAGQENVKDCFFSNGSNPDLDWAGCLPAEREFNQRYVEYFPDKLYADVAPCFYPYLMILRQAIEKSQSLNTDKLVEAFHTYEFHTIVVDGKFYGKERFGIDNQFPAPVWITRVDEKGAMRTVAMVPPPERLLP
jgi:branched-chain amino acid transport system substrate-binding protein